MHGKQYLPTGKKFQGRELTIAKQLIESMATDWNPENYRDTCRARAEDLIKRKQRGEEIVTEGGAPEESNVVDLMDALRPSAEQARGRRPAQKRTTSKQAKGKRTTGKQAAGPKSKPGRKTG